MMKKYFVFAAIAVLPLLGAVDENSPMLKEFLQTAATFPADNSAELVRTPMLKWESHREYRIIFSNAEYYSFKAVESSYTGGAHGMSKTTVGTFRNGRRVKLADLGNQQKLTEKWQQAIAQHFKAASFAEYVRRKDVFKPYMTGNFYLDDKGIHFIYNPIEIDCYAAGTIDIFVPWKFDK